jgi:hypothetical protein
MIYVIVIVIANQDSTSSRLLPGSSYSCCIRNLHALVYKHPIHITTAHEILQRRKWQLCKSTLPPNHSGSWTRKEKMGFVIHRKVVHSQSCTSLAATRKPSHSLMPANFHPQVMATEAEPSHAKHQRMWNAQSSTQIWMWSRLFTQRRGAKALHVSVLHCSSRMQEFFFFFAGIVACSSQPKAEQLELPCPSRAGCTCPSPHNSVHQHTGVTRLAVHTKSCDSPLTAPHLLALPPIATNCLWKQNKQWQRTSHMLSAR